MPRRESGYTTDDNARALRLYGRLWDQQPNERMLARVTCAIRPGGLHGWQAAT